MQTRYQQKLIKSNNPSHDKLAVASSAVHQKENEAISCSLESKLNALSIRNQKYPLRSEYVSGPTICLRTNYFEIQSNPKAQLFRYDISIGNLNDKQKRKKPRIIKILLEDPFFSTVRPSPATDFSGSIVTTTKLQLQRTPVDQESKEFNVRYRVRSSALTYLYTTPLGQNLFIY